MNKFSNDLLGLYQAFICRDKCTEPNIRNEASRNYLRELINNEGYWINIVKNEFRLLVGWPATFHIAVDISEIQTAKPPSKIVPRKKKSSVKKMNRIEQLSLIHDLTEDFINRYEDELRSLPELRVILASYIEELANKEAANE